MEENPGKYIAVTGGGSGTGIAAMINGKCDIANSSREMKEKEVAMAKDNGKTPKLIVVALDGLSVVTNPNNLVDKLTVDQIGAIFRGDITNWSEVGGVDMPITLYGRQSNSGTFVYFQDEILKGDYSPKMNRMNGNAQIVEAIKTDKSAIGYVGIGYIKENPDLGVIKVAARPGAEYADPRNSAAVKSGAYPIARPLNQYIDASPKGAVADFLAFELSDKGQEIVVQEGFFPVPESYKKLNAEAGIK